MTYQKAIAMIDDISPEYIKALRQALQADLAHTHIEHFFKLIKPENVINWHHKIMLDTIQDFIDKKIKNLIISIPPQHGKFLKGDTPVLTTKGWKQHSDLCAGDYVFSDTGEPVIVIANSGVYDWHVNKVEFAGGEVLYAADEHLWKVQVGEDGDIGKPFIVTDTANIKTMIGAKQVSISSFCLLPTKYECDKFVFKNIESFGIVTGNCIQVEGGMYLAGESLIPTHNSEIASRILPAYLLGIKPKCRIISASYNADNSSKFNRDVQRIIDSPEYKIAFPTVTLNGKAVRTDKDGAWLRNKDEFEIVEYGGYYKNAGVGGGITGRTADYAIIDDPVKGAADAASPTVRQSIYNWFVQDLGSRLNNNSQKLIIMTRWHEQDLVGMLLNNPAIAARWHVLSLPAIREDLKDKRDPRKIGEAMWEGFQGIDRLNEAREQGERFFRCLYQQDPKANRDILVYPDFSIIEDTFYDDIAKSEVFGLDFGFNDELALIGTKLHDRQLFIKEYVYERGITPDALIELLKAKGIKGQLLVCDNSRPELINHLRKNGFNAVPCDKGAGSIYTGIQHVKSFALSYTRGSGNIITETQNYEWLTDAGGFATEVPKGKKDHALDALRYATVKQVQLRHGAGKVSYLDMTVRR